MGLVSFIDAINTTSAQGRLVFNLFASLAEFERELIRERTHVGLASARTRGRVGGRQRGLSEEAERTAIIAETLYREQQLGVNKTAQRLRISKVTLYKYLCHRKVAIHAHRKPEARGHAPAAHAQLLAARCLLSGREQWQSLATVEGLEQQAWATNRLKGAYPLRHKLYPANLEQVFERLVHYLHKN